MKLALKRAVMYLNVVAVAGAESFLSTLSTDTASQLDVLGHDGHTLGVDGAQVGVFKETDQVSLASLLQGHNSGALETEIGLEVLGDLTDQTLEGQFADQAAQCSSGNDGSHGEPRYRACNDGAS